MQKIEKNLVISDIHLGVMTFSTNYQKSFVEFESKELLNWVLEFSKKYMQLNYCDLNLIFLGDWFNYNNPKFDLIIWTMDFFKRASEIYKNIYFIPGNHDYRPDGYCTDFLNRMNLSNFHYFNMESNNYVVYISGQRCLFVPFYDEEKYNISYDKFIRYHWNFNDEKKGILFGHFYDNYAKIGSESNIITKRFSNISLGSYSDFFHTVISGHIHTNQMYVSNNVNIIYPGTLQSFTGHDLNQQKKILIFSCSNDDKTNTNVSSISYEWILTPSTLFISREYNSNDSFEDLIPDKNYVIYLKYNPKEVELAELIEKCKLWKNEHSNIKHINLNALEEDNSIIEYGKNENDSDEVPDKILSFLDIILNNVSDNNSLYSYLNYLIKVNESKKINRQNV